MKKTLQLTLFFIFFSGLTLLAQAPPTPPSNASDGGNGPVGGNAPVGSGMVIMLALGAVYAGWKKYDECKHAD